MAVSIVFNTGSAAGLAELNEFMISRSYLVGFKATQADIALVAAIGTPDKEKFPHLFRYVSHINALTAAEKSKLTTGVTVVAGAAKAAASGAGDDDDEDDDEDDDMFGDDSDGEDAGAALAAKAAAAKAAAAKKAGGKKKKIEKTSIVWEVKPAEVDSDLDAVEERIRGITMEGLKWGEVFQKVPVAFGIVKLVISAVCEDEKTSIVDIEDEIESWDDLVGSIEQLDMQKVT